METKFQTSFIPKKPIIQDSSTYKAPKSTSVFMMIAVFIFLISVGGAVFAFVAEGLLIKRQEQYQLDLVENEKSFNEPLIDEIKKANTKIDFAKKLITNHVAITEALTIVSQLVAEKVTFSDFSITAPGSLVKGEESTYKITMRGVANSFSTLAFQSDVFGASSRYGTNKVLKNPILSDLTTDDNGDVKFNFTAEIRPQDISYEKQFLNTIREEGLLPVEN